MVSFLEGPKHYFLFIYFLPHTCHVPSPSHPPSDEQCNILWQYVTWIGRYAAFSNLPLPSSEAQIALSTLPSNTLSLCSSPGVRNQVSHPHETAGKNVSIAKYINCFEFLWRVIVCLFVVWGVLQVPRECWPDWLCLTAFWKAPHTMTSVEGFALCPTNWLRSRNCVGRHVRSKMCRSFSYQC